MRQPVLAAILSFGACLLSLGACAPPPADKPAEPDAPAPAGEAEHDEHELGTTVRLEPAVIEAARLAWAPAQRQVLAPTVWVAGEIQADPDRVFEVAAKVAGIFETVDFREGDKVTEGQVLATIRAPGLGGMRADQASLQARAASARANLARLEMLAQRGMAAQQELAAARAEASALQAEAAAAGQRLQALGLGKDGKPTGFALRAPLSGVVTRRGVVVGQAVLAEQMVATIVDLGEVWFVARVFEHTLSRVEIGAAAEVQLNALPGERFVGNVAYIAPQTDPGARTIVARIPLANPDQRLRLGLFGAATIAVPDPDGRPAGTAVLAVPREAVTDVGDHPAVFVRRDDGAFELHRVVLGASAPGLVEIAAGLVEGEAVVTRGAFTLKSVLLKHTFAEEEH